MSIKTIGIIGHRKIRKEDIQKIIEAMSEWAQDIDLRPRKSMSVKLLTSLACGADQILANWLKNSQLAYIQPFKLIQPTWKTYLDNKKYQTKLQDEIKILTYINEKYGTLKDAGYVEHVTLRLSDHISGKIFLDWWKDTSKDDHYQELVKKDQRETAFPWDIEKIIIEHPNTVTHCLSELISEGEENDAYRDAGRYISDHCDLLLVLWDGVENGKVGGTSDTMEYARSEECRDKRKDGGPEIHQLVIPHQGNPFPVGVPFEIKKFDRKPILSKWKKLKNGGVSLIRWTINHLRYRPFQIFILGVLALVTIVLGEIGAHENEITYNSQHTDQHQELSIFNRVLYSFALLVLGNFTEGEIENGYETWARLFAVAFFIAVAAAVAISYLGGEVKRWWVARCKHTILVGTGWKGRTLAEELLLKGESFIVIEKAGCKSTLEWCSKYGIPVVIDDALTEESWSKAGLKNASQIFIFCGDDQVSMECTAVAARTYEKIIKKKYPIVTTDVECNVELKTQRNFQVLKNALPKETRLRLNVLNVEVATARILMREYPLDRFEATPDAKIARIVVIGNTSMARAILRQAMQVGIFEQTKSLKVDWFVEKPSRVAKEFLSRYPAFKIEKVEWNNTSRFITPSDEWVSSENILPEIHIHSMTESDDSLLHNVHGFEEYLTASDEKQVVSVYVAIDEGNRSVRVAENIATVMMRIRKEKKTDIQLFCYVGTGIVEYRHDMHRTINATASDLPIKIFGDFVDNFSEDNVTGKKTDRLAVKLCGMYERLYCDSSCSDENAWNKSSENDKDSNRQASTHADVKKRYYDRITEMVIKNYRKRVKIYGAKQEGAIRKYMGKPSNYRIQMLARMEHRRWCAEYLLKGFRPLNTENNYITDWFSGKKKYWKSQKRHLDLMPFDKLQPVIGYVDPIQGAQEPHKDKAQITFILDEGNSESPL